MAMAIYPIVHLIVAPPHLYADGTNFFLNSLNRLGFYAFDQPRLFAQLISQFPLVLALQLGERHLSSLGLIYSASLLGIPGAIWLAAAGIQFRQAWFWQVVAAYSIVFLPGSLFAIGEYNLCYAINALILSLLLLPGIALWSSILIAALAVANAFTYEANLFLAPLLILVIQLKLRAQAKPMQLANAFLHIAAFAALLAFGVALASILFPRDPSNLQGAGNVKMILKTLPLILAATIPLLPLLIKPRQRKLLLFTSLFLAPFFVVYVAHFLRFPGLAYGLRSGLVFALIVCLAIHPYIIRCWRDSRFGGPLEPDQIASSSSLYFGLLVAMLAICLIRAFGFGAWLNDYRTTLNGLSRSTPIDQTILWQTGDRHLPAYLWGWNNQQLSFLLDPQSSVSILNPSHELSSPTPIRVPMGAGSGFLP